MALIQAPSDKHAKKSKTNAYSHKHASDASRRVFTQGVPICLQAFLRCLEIGSQGFFASCEAQMWADLRRDLRECVGGFCKETARECV